MADQKISELTALTGANVADDDAIAIVDTSATETKKIVFSELKNALDTATGFVRITGDTMTGDLTVPNVVVSGNVDGRDVSADGTKLDGIEASADVTDATNVAAAGALMDSEVTNLAQVKAFDSSDYATAAQGSTADAALPKAGGTMTGNLAVSAASPNIDVTDTGTSHASQDFLTNSNAVRATIGVERSAGGGLFVGSSPYAAVFGTASAGNTEFATSNNVRMTISSSGSVGIGTSSPSSFYANHLVVDTGSSVQSGITIVSDTGNQGMFAFADGTSGDQRYRGFLDYNHSNDTLGIGTAGAERMSIEPNAVRFATDEVTPTGSGKDLGSPTYQWRDIYMSGSIEIENGTGNVGVGQNALRVNTNSYNTAVGMNACYTNSSGKRNTSLGYDALYTNSSGHYNVAIGMQALLSNTASNNTAVGYQAGYSNSTGALNTFLGKDAGYYVTGSKNTIVGAFHGNQGGLDIRTSSNNIVLSDGDGNPRVVVDSAGSLMIGAVAAGQVGANNAMLTMRRDTGSCGISYQSGTAPTDQWETYSNLSARFYIENVSTSNGVYLQHSSSSGWVNVSDQRWKTDWALLDDASSKIAALSVGKYHMLNNAKESIENAKWDYGVKAQGFQCGSWLLAVP